MHQYRGSRPWSVLGLAASASAAALILSGTIASALPEPAVYGEPAAPEPPSVPAPPLPARADAVQSAPAAEPRPPVFPAAPASEGWQVQAGAFASRNAAEAHLRALAEAIPAASGAEISLQPAGRLTRARFVGLGGRSAAAALCARLAAAGSDCFVIEPGS